MPADGDGCVRITKASERRREDRTKREADGAHCTITAAGMQRQCGGAERVDVRHEDRCRVITNHDEKRKQDPANSE